MRPILACLLCLALLAPAPSIAQGRPAPKPTDPELLRELDRDVWRPFAAAFAAGRADDYLALHSRSFIRAMGDAKRVEPVEAWMKGTRGMFKSFADRGTHASIAFRFLERLANAEAASERGVFQFTMTDAQGKSRVTYGRFHVISRKEEGRWKILVDYDSSEGGTIDQASFLAAHAPDDYGRY
jgi:ketosteroid isomerase-like protein